MQHAEQLHLLRVCLWGALSVLGGTTLLVIAQTRGRDSRLIYRFGVVCALCGGMELIAGALGYRTVPLRDLSGATRLDRLAWFQLGIYLGVAGIGATLVLVAGRTNRRGEDLNARQLSFAGSGVAIALHGLALATLELLLIADISR